MSDTIELRDHSQPCEHGTTFCHTLDSGDWQKTPGSPTTIRTMNDGWCPGGKKIVLPKFLANGVNDYSYELGPADIGWYADPETGEDTFPIEMYRVWVNGDPAEYRKVSDE